MVRVSRNLMPRENDNKRTDTRMSNHSIESIKPGTYSTLKSYRMRPSTSAQQIAHPNRALISEQ